MSTLKSDFDKRVQTTRPLTDVAFISTKNSSDITIGDRSNGILTYWLLDYLREGYLAEKRWPKASDLVTDLHARVYASGLDQTPQFSSEEPITNSTKFNLD